MFWYQKVLEKFNLDMHRLILAVDPDDILKEESILGSLAVQGFEIIEYSDPVAFRLIYEAEFRNRKDRKLIVHVPGSKLSVLPYDVLEVGVPVMISLADFFPKLSYPVLKQLDPDALGRLYQAYIEYDGGKLGSQGTRDFLLLHVYELVPGLIKSKVQLIRMLISLRYRKVQLPGDLVQFIAEKLQGKDFFDSFSVAAMLAGREDFWSFLQEQWGCYIKDKLDGGGTAAVPFEHEDIRVYIDNLFIEGILNPVDVPAGADRLPEWARVGVRGYEEARREQRLSQLTKKLEGLLRQENLSYQHWLNCAPVLAEAKIISNDPGGGISKELIEQFSLVYKQLDALFKEWLFYKYGTLGNLPHTKKPVMVHHIPRYLSYQGRKQGWDRLALVILDGMAWDQWILIKKQLVRGGGLRLDEGSSFAWVPTTTSVSRQAIFAGEPPIYFKDSLFTTSKEEQLWKRFWENEGYKSFHVGLVKGLGDGDTGALDPVLLNPKIKILGLVVDKVDKIVHGQQLGTKGMHQDILLWMQGGYLKALLNSLMENNFRVFITSDHGNVAAVGQGKLDQGVLVESKGERFRTYQDQAFLNEAREKTNSIEWPNKYGLPEGVHVLLAEEQTAYVPEGKVVVSHGGISIEEVIVPFIMLWKEERIEKNRNGQEG